MATRDMSYDLDGVLSTRNQGQLVSSTPAAPSMVRTPGLRPMLPAKMNRGMPAEWKESKRNFLPLGEINIPVIGTISTGSALALVALAGFFLWAKANKNT